MGKWIFFDADGTILDIKRGVAADVPAAFDRLKANGHRIALCTGRSRALLPKELVALPFDAMITNLGAYMEYEGKPIYKKELALPDAAHAVKVLRENGLIPVLEGWDRMYYDLDEYTTQVDWYADLITELLEEKLLPITCNENDLHYSKISAKVRPGSTPERAVRELSDLFDFIHHEGAFVGNTIECIAKGHSKGLAIAILCEVLGIPDEDTIAFGDSNNDLTMFRMVHTKVAMGDASAELAAAADLVTDTMGQGGISKALRTLGLI